MRVGHAVNKTPYLLRQPDLQVNTTGLDIGVPVTFVRMKQTNNLFGTKDNTKLSTTCFRSGQPQGHYGKIQETSHNYRATLSTLEHTENTE